MVFYALFAAGFDWPAAAALFLFPHLFHSSLWAPGNFVVRNLSLLITLNPPAPKAQVCNCPFLFPWRRRGVAARMGFGRLCFASTTDRLVLGGPGQGSPRRRLSSAPGTAFVAHCDCVAVQTCVWGAGEEFFLVLCGSNCRVQHFT